jgi:hypothetical protein
VTTTFILANLTVSPFLFIHVVSRNETGISGSGSGRGLESVPSWEQDVKKTIIVKITMILDKNMKNDDFFIMKTFLLCHKIHYGGFTGPYGQDCK